MDGLRNTTKTGVLLLTLLLIISANGQSTTKQIKEVSDVVERIRSEYAPDSRLDLFSIHIKNDGEGIVLSGEVSNRLFRDVLIDTLSRMYNSNFI